MSPERNYEMVEQKIRKAKKKKRIKQKQMDFRKK
jgi:hypothetical protein